MNSWIAERTGTRFIWLLCALLALLLLAPVFESGGYDKGLLVVLLTLVLLAAINAARGRRGQLITAICLGLPWLVLHWIPFTSELFWLRIVEGMSLLARLYFTAGVVLGSVVSAEKVDKDILCGGLAIYLLLGVTWAVSYDLIEFLVPGSFTNVDPEIAWTRLVYFSFTTLTTLGYGDISPTTPFAQTWSVLEAGTGVLYVAVLVARLVSLYQR